MSSLYKIQSSNEPLNNGIKVVGLPGYIIDLCAFFAINESATICLKWSIFVIPYIFLKSSSDTNHKLTWNGLSLSFGNGICGQVAVSNQNFVVPDVSAQDNYIACSITVKAEIVVPVFVNGENVGQIDIDSNTPDPFTEADERFLEFVCEKVAVIL